jgi:hypothetical protein
MLPLFVRQGISLLIRQSEITTSCGIGQRCRYLVDGGRVIRAGGGRPGLTGTQVGHATGPVTVFPGGRRFGGDPRSIKLTPHAVIQLDVGKVVPPQPFTFPAGL